MSSYDVIEYKSHPYKNSTPERMFSVATLFGLQPPDYKKARVLEMGCASGGNIIPLAYRYPEAEFVGIDLSSKQIESGQSLLKKLSVNNVTLREASINDLGEEDGLYDYIVCHGVFSWVNQETQHNILEACKKLLTDNGIAYISYNTLPGWNMVKTIRDMMEYHTGFIEKEEDKPQHARAILNFTRKSTEKQDTPYAKFLAAEADHLSKVEDYYIFHEHLEDENNPMYFHEFAKMAADHDLKYLADSVISTMYTGNLSEFAQGQLKQMKDIIRIEQYTDFITNRRFRCSLLCKNINGIKRNITPAALQKFFLTTSLRSKNAYENYQLTDDSAIEFSHGATNCTFNQPVLKTAVHIIIQARAKPVSWDEMLNQVAEKTGISKEVVNKALTTNPMLLQLTLMGIIEIYSDNSISVTEIDEKPVAFELARVQAQEHDMPATLMHNAIKLSQPDLQLIPLLDGTRDKKQLLEALCDLHGKGSITVNIEGKPVTDKAIVEKQLTTYLDNALQRFALNNLLVKS